MQFSTGNRFKTLTSHENNFFASKNASEVALCLGSVITIILQPVPLRWELNRASTRLCTFLVANLVDALGSFEERSEIGCKRSHLHLKMIS